MVRVAGDNQIRVWVEFQSTTGRKKTTRIWTALGEEARCKGCTKWTEGDRGGY